MSAHQPLLHAFIAHAPPSCVCCRSKVAGDHTREAELLENHMQDLDQLAKMKEENADLKKAQEHLR